MSLKVTIAATAAAVMMSAGSLMAATSGLFDGAYEVTNANDGKHGVWLKDFIIDTGSSYDYWGINEGSFSYSDGTALLEANVQNYGDSNLTMTLSAEFEHRDDFAGAPKCEYGACPASSSDWEYFSITSASLSGTGILSGLELILAEFPSNYDQPPQLGYGANSKSATELGFATWLSWVLTSGPDADTGYAFDEASGTLKGYQHGDINIALEPVPLPAAGWMLLAAMGGLAGMRRRKT